MTSKRKYRSKLESMVGSYVGPEWRYEPFQVPYTVDHKYTPDFVYDEASVEILVEVKGYFRPGDTQKYKAIRDSLDDDQELIFFLSSPNAKVRKGAKMTMSGWCEKENIIWFADPEEMVAYAHAR